MADLEEIIDELRNEMVFKEIQFKEMRSEMERLEAENKQLKSKFKSEQSKRQEVEGFYVKQLYQQELTQNQESIQSGTFLEARKNTSSSQGNASLQSQIITQQKLNKAQSLAIKFGRKWLETVRERRRVREREAFFSQA